MPRCSLMLCSPRRQHCRFRWSAHAINLLFHSWAEARPITGPLFCIFTTSPARGPKPAVREVECDCLEKRQAKRLSLLDCRMPSLLSKKDRAESIHWLDCGILRYSCAAEVSLLHLSMAALLTGA